MSNGRAQQAPATRGAPGRPRVPREVREREMLEVAGRIFGERGFHAVSMEEIAAECGITKPMLYAYYGSKEGLFAACAQDAADRLMTHLREVAGDRALPPDLILWRGLLAVFEFVEEHRDAWELVYQPHAREATAELLTELLLEVGRREGLRPEIEPETASQARALTGAAFAMVDWWLQNPAEPKERMALRLMNYIWMGFGRLLEGELWLPDEARTTLPRR